MARKIVQAKFYVGILNYSEQELLILESWIREKGVERMEKLFNKILANKKQEQLKYQNSPMQNLFAKILSERSYTSSGLKL